MKIRELDETRLRAIMKNARYQQNIPPSKRFAIAMEHIEGLHRLRAKSRRIEKDKYPESYKEKD